MSERLARKIVGSIVSAGFFGVVLMVCVRQSVAEDAPDRDDAPAVQPELRMALELLESSMSKRSNVEAYACWVCIRERNRMREREGDEPLIETHLSLKVRREPFLAYAYVHAPARRKGEEYSYDSTNKRPLSARRRNVPGAIYEPVQPGIYLLREDTRLRIDEQHMDAMSDIFATVLRSHLDKEQARIRIFEGAKVNSRLAKVIELSYAQQAPGQNWQAAKMFLDDETGMPMHFESYAWPSGEGDEPSLIESYTFLNITFVPPQEVEAWRFEPVRPVVQDPVLPPVAKRADTGRSARGRMWRRGRL